MPKALSEGDTSTPQEAIEKAQEALAELSRAASQQSSVGKIGHAAVGAVSVLAIGGLIVHTFFEAQGIQVDSTSVALLAVALIAPFVPRLRALEVGGAKAEWAAEAAVSLKEILSVLNVQQEAISQLFNEVKASATAVVDQAAPRPVVLAPAVEATATVRSMHRVLWVDDHPENNSYELQSLRESVDVVAVRSNDEAMELLSSGDIDVVISDISRDDDPPGKLPGGVQLLQILSEMPETMRPPILYYTSERSIETYGGQLEADGAYAVTSLFSGLTRGLRQLEERNLAQLAIRAALPLGTVAANNTSEGPDLVVQLKNGWRIGIGVGSWLQRPQMGAFADRVKRVRTAQESGETQVSVLLHRQGVLDKRRRDFAESQGVLLAEPDTLTTLLASRVAAPTQEF